MGGILQLEGGGGGEPFICRECSCLFVLDDRTRELLGLDNVILFFFLSFCMYVDFLPTLYQFGFRHLDVLDLWMRICVFFIALYVCVSFAFYCIIAIVMNTLWHVDSTRKKRIYEQNKNVLFKDVCFISVINCATRQQASTIPVV